MVEFKVGDKVKIIGRKSHDSNNLDGKLATIKSLESTDSNDNIDYVYVEEFGTGGLWLDEIELVKLTNVKKQVAIQIKGDGISVHHTTNTKKNRVTLLFTGTKTGSIKFEKIDEYIDLLTQLKSEV